MSAPSRRVVTVVEDQVGMTFVVLAESGNCVNLGFSKLDPENLLLSPMDSAPSILPTE